MTPITQIFVNFTKIMKMNRFRLIIIAAFTCLLTMGASVQADAQQKKYVTELTTEAFNAKVFNTASDEMTYLGKLPAIVDFTATWCGPCQRTAPILEEIAREYAGRIVVYKVDVDKCPKIAQAMNISSIPAILYIPADNGKPVMTVGARGKEQFRTEISKYLLK